jgi:hypothetical protein
METYTPFLICQTLSAPTPGLRCLGAMQTGTLVDGTHAYVLENKTLYVLDKGSAADPTGGIVAAINGGNWLPLAGVGVSLGALNVVNIANKTLSLTGTGNFLSLNDAAASYQSRFTGEGWSVSTTTGIATWNGAPDSSFLFNATASMQNASADIETLMGVSLSGSVQNFQAIQQSNHVPGPAAFYELSITGIMRLGQGDTLDLVFAGGASDILVTKLSYTLAPLT